jgi:hypothetical protein
MRSFTVLTYGLDPQHADSSGRNFSKLKAAPAGRSEARSQPESANQWAHGNLS